MDMFIEIIDVFIEYFDVFIENFDVFIANFFRNFRFKKIDEVLTHQLEHMRQTKNTIFNFVSSNI